jgi:hypothetical protein
MQKKDIFAINKLYFEECLKIKKAFLSELFKTYISKR